MLAWGKMPGLCLPVLLTDPSGILMMVSSHFTQDLEVSLLTGEAVKALEK